MPNGVTVCMCTYVVLSHSYLGYQSFGREEKEVWKEWRMTKPKKYCIEKYDRISFCMRMLPPDCCRCLRIHFYT